jgi:uncharacterized protein YqeY
MSKKEELTQALRDAMRARDDRRKSAIRLTLAAIKNAEIEAMTELEDSEVLAIIQKEIKSRRETIEAAERANREDIIAESKTEIEILEAFLPQPLTIEELEELARAAIVEAGATSPREMGSVMKLLMNQVRGRADGKTVSQIIRQLLSQ